MSQHLRDEELVLWKGYPNQRLKLLMLDVFIIIGGLLWVVFVATILQLVIDKGVSLPIMGSIPVLVLMPIIIASRFFYDKKQRNTIQFGVTNERLIIINRTVELRIYSFEHSESSKLKLRINKDTSGDILIANYETLLPPHPAEMMFLNDFKLFRGQKTLLGSMISKIQPKYTL